jgi:hypothetical protein
MRPQGGTVLCFLLILYHASCVTYKPLSIDTPLAFTLPKIGNTMYLKIDMTTSNHIFYLRPILEACSGNFEVFVKYCRASCNDTDVWIPSAQNKDFYMFKKGTLHGAYIDMCSSPFSKCANDKVYYLAVSAVRSDTDVSVNLLGFEKSQFGSVGVQLKAYAITEGDTSCSFEKVTYCEAASKAGQCTNTSAIETTYQLYYIETPSNANLGTVCGMKKYGKAMGDAMKDVNQLAFQPPLDREILANIVAITKVDGRQEAIAYLPFITTHNDTGSHVLPFLLGATSFLLLIAVVIIIVVVIVMRRKRVKDADREYLLTVDGHPKPEVPSVLYE